MLETPVTTPGHQTESADMLVHMHVRAHIHTHIHTILIIECIHALVRLVSWGDLPDTRTFNAMTP